MFILEDSPCTDEGILRLESEIGSCLPERYRDFLLDLNGGYIGSARDDFELAGLQICPPDRFYSLARVAERYWSPDETRRLAGDRGLLQIAESGYGDEYFIGLGSHEYGEIHVCSFENRYQYGRRDRRSWILVRPDFMTLLEIYD